jgi:hypothetical protein
VVDWFETRARGHLFMCHGMGASTWGSAVFELASFTFRPHGPLQVKVVSLIIFPNGFFCVTWVYLVGLSPGHRKKPASLPTQRSLKMFSKFRVSKRTSSEDEESPGLVLVSTSRISENGSKRSVLQRFHSLYRSCRHRVGRPIHDQKCAGCVKDRQSVPNPAFLC